MSISPSSFNSWSSCFCSGCYSCMTPASSPAGYSVWAGSGLFTGYSGIPLILNNYDSDCNCPCLRHSAADYPVAAQVVALEGRLRTSAGQLRAALQAIQYSARDADRAILLQAHLLLHEWSANLYRLVYEVIRSRKLVVELNQPQLVL